jgi:ribose/xylose/arabinose/galactoside ABC-type transport system permease subunit
VRGVSTAFAGDVPSPTLAGAGGGIGARLREADVWLVFLAMVALATFLAPTFLTPFNIENLLGQSAIIGLLTVGQFLVVLSGGFDLSVAAVLALSSVIFARSAELGLLPAALLALGAAVGLGIVNGLTVTWGRVPPLIATLAMMGIARGLAFSVSNGSVRMDNEPFSDFADRAVAVLPVPAIVWLGFAALVYAFLRLSRYGLHIYAVGGREDTARLAGVPVGRVKLLVYAISGLLAGVGGILYVARSSSGQPQVGAGWELDTIAAVVIGGASLFGGAGSLVKVTVGVLIYMMIRNVLNLMGTDPYLQDMLTAVVIFGAVALRLARSEARD